jgi:anti-anti-sigma regulatory factor
VVGKGMVERLQLGDHVCAFADGVDECLDVMAQTVADGLDAGDKIMVFTESLQPIAALAGVAARGVAVQPAQRDGRLHVLPAGKAYLPAGRFEPSRMLSSLAGHIDQAAAEGRRGLRVVGDMAWALDEPAGVDRLPGYEAQANHLYMDARALGVCLYDRRSFDADLLRQAAGGHPVTATAATLVGAHTGWLSLRIRRTTDPYGLRLIGEIDLSNRQAVTAALDAVLEQQPDPAVPIVVDVAGLRFADAATAGLIGWLALRAPAGVHTVGCHEEIETILNRLGVTQLPRMRLTRAAGPDADAVGSDGTEMVA